MNDFKFDRMTPALEAYLHCDSQTPMTVRMDLYNAVEPGLAKEYSAAQVVWRCQEENYPEAKEKRKVVTSPSGRYTLTISLHPQDSGDGKSSIHYWGYTKGTVTGGDLSAPVIVCRNYPSYPHLFVEDHPDGNDYLVCGRDYQSQTIVNLKTGETRDHTSPPNFCWAAYTASPSKLTLAVDGCYWGASYEVIMVDFSTPMTGLTILRQEGDEGYAWVEGEPDTAYLDRSGRVCLLFGGKEERNLTDEEEDAASDAEDRGERVWAPKETLLWTRPGTGPVSS